MGIGRVPSLALFPPSIESETAEKDGNMFNRCVFLCRSFRFSRDGREGLQKQFGLKKGVRGLASLIELSAGCTTGSPRVVDEGPCLRTGAGGGTGPQPRTIPPINRKRDSREIFSSKTQMSTLFQGFETSFDHFDVSGFAEIPLCGSALN
eukprot:6390812-Amphidinium_carterae.3